MNYHDSSIFFNLNQNKIIKYFTFSFESKMENVIFVRSKYFLEYHPLDWMESDQPKIQDIQSMMLRKSSIQRIDLKSKYDKYLIKIDG